MHRLGKEGYTRRAVNEYPPRVTEIRVRHPKHIENKKHKRKQSYYTMGDPLHISTWKRIIESQPAFKAQKERELHHTYCRECPMYQLLNGPRDVLQFKDSTTGNVVKRIAFVDRIIYIAIEYVRRRLPCVNDVSDMPKVKHMLDRIASTELDDPSLKIFFLCFLLTWFPHVKSWFLSLFPNDTPRAQRKKENMEALFPHIAQWCYGITISRYNVSTIDNFMHLFLYSDLIPTYASGALPIGTPVYNDEMRTKQNDIKRHRKNEKQRLRMIRLRKRSQSHRF